MTLLDDTYTLVKSFGDDSYREGYLQALADLDVMGEELIPHSELLERRLRERNERLDHRTGAPS